MAALASWLDAKAHAGQWFVRIEDIDPPRESPGATADILRALDLLGLQWDGDIVYQSQRHAAYEEALTSLLQQKLAYYCTCSRGLLAGTDGHYPGFCRNLLRSYSDDAAIRCKVSALPCGFIDELQGPCSQLLETECGDFVIKRKDGLPAYQLAVVVDDAWQQITHVVRGLDLLDSTPRQIHLQRLLQLPTPSYSHIPVLINKQQQKLSKQNLAAAIDTGSPVKVLYQTLLYLQQQPEPGLIKADRNTILEWAVSHWNSSQLAGIRLIPEIAAFPTAAV